MKRNFFALTSLVFLLVFITGCSIGTKGFTIQEAIEKAGREVDTLIHVEEIKGGALAFYTRKLPNNQNYIFESAFLQKKIGGWKWVNGGGHSGNITEGFSFQYLPKIDGNSLSVIFGEIINSGIEEVVIYEPKELLDSRQGLGEKAEIVSTDISDNEKITIWFSALNESKGPKFEIVGLSNDDEFLEHVQIDVESSGSGTTKPQN